METEQTFAIAQTEWRELFRCYLYLRNSCDSQILPDYMKESLSIIDGYHKEDTSKLIPFNQ